MSSETIRIFDTTLRDGEQSPGCSMNLKEKLALARQLERLGVDVIEAGFPIASDGDFDSVQAIARELDHVIVCGLARTGKLDVERAGQAGRQLGRRGAEGDDREPDHHRPDPRGAGDPDRPAHQDVGAPDEEDQAQGDQQPVGHGRMVRNPPCD